MMGYGQSFYSSGGGIPAQITTDMNAVLNKKFGTSGQSYPADEWADNVNLMGLLPEKTVSGSVASFADGADDVPIKTATFDIAPTLDGVSAVNVTQQGKNLFNKADYTYIQAYMMNGTVTYNSSHTLIYMPCKPNTNYTVSRERTVSNERFAVAWSKVIPENGSTVYDINRATDSGTVGDTMSVSVTTGSDAVYLVIWAWWSSSDSTTALNTMQIEVGSSATAYTAYTTPETRTISLGQTVYGGSVTVDEDGECELESTYCTPIDLGSLDWTFYSNAAYPYMMANISDYKWVNNNPNVECEGYNFASIGSSGNAEGFFITNTNIIRIRDLNYQTAESLTDFKAHVTGLELSYEVTTPTTSDLDPITPITSALGVNNIWCDTGDVEVVYRADIALALNS